MKIRVARKPADVYQHGNLRQALVQAGLKLLTEGGLPALSLRGAAQLAGVSHAAPYRHFKDKDALLAAIAEQGFRVLTACMQEEADKLAARTASASAQERLLALGKGYLHFAVEHPAYLQLLFGGVLSPELKTAELQAAGEEAYGLLRGCVADGLARGELRGGDAETVALAAWSLVHGLSHLIISRAVVPPPGREGLDRLSAGLITLLGEGVNTRR